MEYRRFGDTYVVRLQKGEEIASSLAELCRNEGIKLAAVEGIGAADHLVIGLYDVGTRVYHKTEFNGPMEITSLLGNVSRKDGEVYLHLHINVCDTEMNVIGGHMNECRIGATGEIFIREIPGEVERLLDEEETGLNLYRFL
ncbi:MAG: DNA-binding protein [Lachnospiraceae bacterium]|nr:DNA-binding protein [Lachnospiraceae bacterium]